MANTPDSSVHEVWRRSNIAAAVTVVVLSRVVGRSSRVMTLFCIVVSETNRDIRNLTG